LELLGRIGKENTQCVLYSDPGQRVFTCSLRVFYDILPVLLLTHCARYLLRSATTFFAAFFERFFVVALASASITSGRQKKSLIASAIHIPNHNISNHKKEWQIFFGYFHTKEYLISGLQKKRVGCGALLN
jgi:hypothetical protein